MSEPEVGSIAWEREQSRRRTDAINAAAHLRGRALRVLERRWNAGEAELLEGIVETYPWMAEPAGAAAREALLTEALRLQRTERPRSIDPSALHLRPPEVEYTGKKKKASKPATASTHHTRKARRKSVVTKPKPTPKPRAAVDTAPASVVPAPVQPEGDAPRPITSIPRVGKEMRARLDAITTELLAVQPHPKTSALIAAVIAGTGRSITMGQARYLMAGVAKARKAAALKPFRTKTASLEPSTTYVTAADRVVDLPESGRLDASNVAGGPDMVRRGPLPASKFGAVIQRRRSPDAGWVSDAHISGLTASELAQVEELIDSIATARAAHA